MPSSCSVSESATADNNDDDDAPQGELTLNTEAIRIYKLYEIRVETCAALQDVIFFSLLCCLYDVWWNRQETSKGSSSKKRKKRYSRRAKKKKKKDYLTAGLIASSDTNKSGDECWMSSSQRKTRNQQLLVSGEEDIDDMMRSITDDLDELFSDEDSLFDDVSLEMKRIFDKWDRKTDINRLLQLEFDSDGDGIESFLNCNSSSSDDTIDSADSTRSSTSSSTITSFHDVYKDYEEILLTHSILLGCTWSDMHSLCKSLLDISAAISQSSSSGENERDEKTNIIHTGTTITSIPKQNRSIDNHTNVDLINLTRFNREQLHRIKSLFFGNEPGDSYTVSSGHHTFTYEETLLIALSYMANAETYFSMYRHFGGDWTAYIHAINWFTNFVFVKYYHCISGSSMEYWASSVHHFRWLIWNQVCVSKNGNALMPFEEFYNFGFMDCISYTTRTSASPAREYQYDIRRALYTGCVNQSGVKMQGIVLPNGMIGYALCRSISHNEEQDKEGVIKLSPAVETELVRVLRPYRIGYSIPTLYTDERYEISQLINQSNGRQSEYFEKMSQERKKVEHLFGSTTVHNLWKGLIERNESIHDNSSQTLTNTSITRHVMCIWFIMNVYTCLNGNRVSLHYNTQPPSLEDYLSNVPPYAGNPDEPDILH